MTTLRRLWAGDLPLDEAFWTFAVLYGVTLNLLTSLAFLALISTDRPWLALAAGYGPSLPYNILITVGVFRSAAREGPSSRADLYRILTVLGAVVLTVT
jgi:hypothetical protein